MDRVCPHISLPFPGPRSFGEAPAPTCSIPNDETEASDGGGGGGGGGGAKNLGVRPEGAEATGTTKAAFSCEVSGPMKTESLS